MTAPHIQLGERRFAACLNQALPVPTMTYDYSNCPNCPYVEQVNLPDELRTTRLGPPVELECHGSKTLIVGEAPGIEEWRAGAPFQPTKRVGGTAGARVARSWERVGKRREDFDILNVVQCYPGVAGKRDARPDALAVSSCANRLAEVLIARQYTRVVCLGEVAKQVVLHLRKVHDLSFEVVQCPHPTGGASKMELDSVW
jgi:uracil-DNA glycosylase family 4